MNYEDLVLKNKIMMRVRFIYGLKSLPRVFVPKLAVLMSLVAVSSFFVSMPHVLQNMPSLFEIQNFTYFIVSALLNTKLAIQIAFLGTLTVVGFMLRDIKNVILTGALRGLSA
ncbi:MAG: hypothetical protein EXS46_02185 [Candidatus Taylorbacteria bacterium]|nr:hypothetical protein [Candidatus Taylorbacteria bacterium]